MINNFSSQKIQNDLFILTGYKYSISYVDKTIKRIFKEIILSKKKKFIISGSQGCGKTTLLKLIKNNFKNFYNIDPLCISLDDYYLTKKQRNDLSKRLNNNGVENQIVKSVSDGIKKLRFGTENGDVGLIFGSHYIANEVFMEDELSFDTGVI